MSAQERLLAMRTRLFLGLSAIVFLVAAAVAEPFAWPSQPPKSCPFGPSAALAGISFTGRHAEYVNADAWRPSLACNGNP